jgi:hypothetical protein
MKSLAVVFVMFLAGCPSDQPDPVAESCQRLDTCNALKAGVSVDECVQDVDKSLDGLTATNRSDWNKLMNNCLGFAACADFLTCVNDSGL